MHPSTTRRVLLASTALTTLLLATAPPAAAADATWQGTTGDFNTGTNWDTNTVPTGTAFFDGSGTTTVDISGSSSLGGLTFNAGAATYVFNVVNDFTLVGAGIVINGGGATFNNANGKIVFSFIGDSTAGGATIVNDGQMDFLEQSTAGNALITNNGNMRFGAAGEGMGDSSTAGNATFINNGSLNFADFTDGGNATITNNAGGLVSFTKQGTAGNAAIVNNAAGTVDFSRSSGPDNDGRLSAGSIAGAGDFILGARELTVGGNGNSTEVSGVISGIGGSLVKTGTGTMILSGANTYTGGTTLAGGTLSVASDANLGDAAGSLTFNGGTLQVTGTAFTTTARTITLAAGGGGFDIADSDNTFTLSQALAGSGGLTKLGFGALVLTGTSTYTGGTTINLGTLQLGTAAATGAIRGRVDVGESGTFEVVNADTSGITTLTNAGMTRFASGTSAGNAAIVNSYVVEFRNSTAGNATITNTNSGWIFFIDGSAGNAGITNNAGIANDRGGLVFIGTGTAGNANITNNGRIAFDARSRAGNAVIGNTGRITFGSNSTADQARIANAVGATLIFGEGGTAGNATITNSGTVSFSEHGTAGTAAIVNIGAAALVDFKDSTGPNNDGKVSAGSIAGGGEYLFSLVELGVGGNNASTEVTGVLSGIGGSLVKTGTGTLVLSGTSDYSGATTVNGGTLAVNGSITASSGVTVNNGGTLGGTGQLPAVTVNPGGNLAPGNSIGTITVNGDLQFNAGSFYTVEVSPAAADRTNVTGAATLTGAIVRSVALPGSFRQQTYTILNAAGGLGGTQFAGLNVTGSFSPARNPHLTYDANNAYLVLDPGALTLAPNATRNQSSVANGINRVVSNGGTPPAGFDTLLNMTSDAAGRALDQLSGESNTQAQTGAFQLGNSFLALLSDPFGTRRDGGAAPLGYAAERSGTHAAVRSAFAAVEKGTAAYAPRWDLWGAGFGGGNKLSGDPAGTGSRDASTRAGAVAAGADYRFAPDSLVGFSLAGGAMNWSVSGNGSGSSDVFMAGVYARHASGPAYLAAAASFANYWMSTTRTVTVAGLDRLDARFVAESFGGRLEAGYRLPARFLDAGWTPYGAIQGQSFRTPDYSETAAIGSNQFALRYAGRTATAWRAEAGLQADRVMAIGDGGELSVFGKAAYAHDRVSDPAVAANFAVLGTTGGFTAFGAQPSQNLLLTSAGAEWRLAAGVSVMVKADGEWGERSRSYGGTGRIRYSW